MEPKVLRATLVKALEARNWKTLVLRNSSDGIELELTRHHVWQLVKHLAGEAALAARN